MKLKDWRLENRYSLPAFARHLVEVAGIRVTGRTIHNWEIGHSLPSLEKAEAIRKATGGKVKADSFRRANSQSS